MSEAQSCRSAIREARPARLRHHPVVVPEGVFVEADTDAAEKPDGDMYVIPCTKVTECVKKYFAELY